MLNFFLAPTPALVPVLISSSLRWTERAQLRPAFSLFSMLHSARSRVVNALHERVSTPDRVRSKRNEAIGLRSECSSIEGTM